MIFAVAVALSAAVGGSVSCSVAAECDCANTGVEVGFLGGTAAEVTTFTASGACGPAPVADADVDVFIPPTGAGTCQIHVVLKDGEVFDETAVVTQSTGCCAGFYGDHRVVIAASGDAGAHD